MPLPALLRHARLWMFLVIIWFVVLWIASSQASYLPPPLFSFQDKVEHALYFCAGSFCFTTAIRLSTSTSSIMVGMKKLLPLWLAVIFAMLLGAGDEFHQTFTPGRSGNDLGDWLADTVGGVLSYLASRCVRWPKSQQQSQK
jgi:VanZ family protein